MSDKTYTESTTTKVSVGNITTTILAEDPSRIVASVVNDSDEVIYLAEGTPAVLNEGPGGLSQMEGFR